VKKEAIDTHIEFSDQSLEFAKKLIDHQENETILFIAPGANFELKIWPKENFIELIMKIKTRFDKVIFLGGPVEFDLCEEISLKTQIVNMVGKTNLVQVSALLSLGTLFIGNDSGLGHISAVQGVNTLSIFAHANPKRYTPHKEHSIYGEDKDIKLITVDEVLLDNENLLT